MESELSIAVDFAVISGLAMRTASGSVTHAPFALAPATIPEHCFRTAVALQPLFNLLVHTVSQDSAFLVSVMDEFLYDRSDSPVKYNLPENNSLTGLTKALARAWELYNNKSAVVVMVVQPGEKNTFDQRWLENSLFEQYNVKLIRRSMAEINEQGTLSGADRKLILTGNIEVAVAYFRAGYAPTDYPTEKEWDSRLLIERSHAIKCPNVAYHLVGSKKIQQILANPNILEKFVPHKPHANLLRSSFTGLFPLDTSLSGLAAVASALESPERYVMKPQREGGGNNIYGVDVRTALQKLTPAERNAYILMELIKPPPARGILVRDGVAFERDVISELAAGHLLRTKVADSNEGGVAAGYSVLDSPNLKCHVGLQMLHKPVQHHSQQ
ncbi:hypothetical protein HK100_002287 [Physocladia obscura]|uniref:Glutathione synthetase n=1 Tax=Physocladia obscura TaxID=109957 RepID=A0AAD5T791_9FUNG|nr:hypothetical protein HK100_002287 [Physocladia obscura]